MHPDVPAQQAYEKLKPMLRKHQVLRELPDEDVAELASRATFEEYKQGAIIIKQGDLAFDFFFIIDGQVRVIDSAKKPPQLINYMHDGQFFGERGLLFNTPRAATIDVIVDVLLARFDKKTWDWLLNKHPAVKRELEALEEYYEEYALIPFPGRHTDEVAIVKTTRHILAYIATLPGPLTMLISGVVLGWLLTDLGLFEPAINYGLSVFIGVLSLLWGLYNFIEWANDDFIVSTKRVIHIERTIIAGEHREEAPLTRVIDVGVSTPNFFTRFFGFSNVVIKTAGAGNIVFDGIEEGDRIKNIIFDQLQQAKERVQASDVASIRKSLADQIGWEGGPLEAPPLKTVDTSSKSRRLRLPRLLRYFIPFVREETPEGITWRKHYWVWLKNIWLPGSVLIVASYLVVASVFIFPPFERFTTTELWYTVGFWLFTFLWYTYQHDDWHKDIYRVTATKIIHQDSTAFRLRGETFRETTFETVQNIDYVSPTFFSRILSMGNVVIKTASVGQNFVFENVYFPRDVQQEIFKRWVEFKDNERQHQRSRDEDRFTKWLKEYHSMMNQP